MIVATARTRNNGNIISRFCEAYQGVADLILLADGGSTDDTVAVAESFANVEVLHFNEQMDVKGGYRINPQGRHVNFLINAAIERGADWITFDDSDCVPNFLLRTDAKKFFADTGAPAIFLRRVYFWGSREIFPKLHKPNTSLWAFRAELPIRADETDPWHLTMRLSPHKNLAPLRPDARHIEFPYCLLHYSWPSPKEAEAKITWYRESGVQPRCMSPLHWAGPIEPAEWFMDTKDRRGKEPL